MRKELESRLINLAISIEKLCKELTRGFLAEHLTRQILRSSSSAALNYGEAQGAESKNDFIHKTSIVLKELRETQIALNLLEPSVTEENSLMMKECKRECGELIAIFHKTVMTAKVNNK